ncbi:helix-turn-helix domain-containing protein [Chryseobacterium arthrosphaerae]|uniref:helix-turn-helix domain-containing protein n=1 Tax=Chryseobacterium arthrosphaerae TaxID=651561 RepID=UPI0030F622ED
MNELKIYYIINKIETDNRYRNYKISYLAEESGFISHSAFATTFKNITGMPPSEFIRISKNSTKSL